MFINKKMQIEVGILWSAFFLLLYEKIPKHQGIKVYERKIKKA